MKNTTHHYDYLIFTGPVTPALAQEQTDTNASAKHALLSKQLQEKLYRKDATTS